MARKRMIDPNIWQSEDYSKLNTLSKLVFIGLFSNADDYGFGRAKATYVKSMLFPYEEGIRTADIEKSLSEIAANMSVVFYKCNGNEYYCLKNWIKWQKVDKPTPSIIPPIDKNTEIIRGTFDENSESIRGGFGEASESLRGTVPPNRIEKNIKEKEKNNITLSDDNVRPTNVEQIIQKWNELENIGVKAITKITSGSKRRALLNARIKEYSFDDVLKAIDNIRQSDFLCGKPNGDWIITFDWFIKPSNFVKVLEGNYDNKNVQADSVDNAVLGNFTSL